MVAVPSLYGDLNIKPRKIVEKDELARSRKMTR